MGAQPGRIVRFGVYEVDLASGELRKQGTPLRLQEQPFQVLSALIEQPGEVVSREDLIRRLWPDGTAVEFDRGLNAAITRLRQVLSDSAESPRYVETVARRGYRFIALIEASSDVVPAIASEPVAAPPIPTNRRWQVTVLLSLLAIAALAWWWTASRRDPVAATTPRRLKAIPLTSEPGNERNVTFSPDGSQIAYEWAEKVGAPPHVYIRQVGLGDPIRLTQVAAGEYGPAWSRDGRYIAFLRQIDENNVSLIVAAVLGGVERKIAELPAPPIKNPIGFARLVDWTADGQRLIVGVPLESGGLEGLWDIRLDTGERRPLSPPVKTFAEGVDHDPAVSPDGRTLAFVRATSLYKRDIFLMSMPDGGHPAGKPYRLTFQKTLALNPAWTRDGKEIVFASDSALWRIEARDGAKAVEIQSLARGHNALPTVGPGGRLAFTHSFVDPNVWRQELTTRGASAGPPTLLISATASENSAEYSPDGSRIALQSNRSGTAEVWVCANTGNRCVQVTSLNAYSGSPRWSPDGQQIAFDSDADGHFQVYAVGATGGSVRRLTNHASDNAAPSWSRDGLWLYFMSSRSGTNEVWKMLAKGGAEAQVTRHGGMMALEAPDGKSLYYTRGDAKSKLYRSATDGSGETQVLDSLFGRSFAVTADRIFYLRQEENGESTLRSFVIATKVDTKIAAISKPTINGVSLSPDGKYVIYTQVDSQGSDLMLVENFR